VGCGETEFLAVESRLPGSCGRCANQGNDTAGQVESWLHVAHRFFEQGAPKVSGNHPERDAAAVWEFRASSVASLAGVAGRHDAMLAFRS
jgi:hypothetical protein